MNIINALYINTYILYPLIFNNGLILILLYKFYINIDFFFMNVNINVYSCYI